MKAMVGDLQDTVVRLLRWSERYTKTDMVYLAQSGFWMNLGTILLSLLSFGLYIVFANIVSKEVYGTYQYLLSLSALISSLTLTGMNYAIMQSTPRGHEGTFRASVSLQLRFGALSLAAACVASLYYFLQDNTQLASGLLIIGFLTPVVSALNTFASYLVGKHMFKQMFVYNMYLYVPVYVLLAITAYAYAHPLALLAINLGVQALILALIYRSITRQMNQQGSVDHEALRFGTRLSAVNFFTTVTGQIDNLLAFHFLGPVPLAIYSFATAIPDRVGGLLKFIYTAALPKFSVRTAHDIRSTIMGNIWRTGALALFAAAAYAIIAPILFTLVFPAYTEAIPYSQLYALTILAYATNIWVSAIISQRYMREYAIFSIGTAVVQTCMQLIGIIVWGLWGLVIAKIASNLFSGLVAGGLFMFKRSVLVADADPISEATAVRDQHADR